MMKHIYKGFFLLIVFVAALFFFGRQLETDISDDGKSAVMGRETFPTLQIMTQGYRINPLYGYAAPMEPDIVRESMTPLPPNRTILVMFDNGAPSRLTKLEYQIVDKESGEVYDSQVVSAISEGQEQVEIVFGFNFKTSMEYILDLKGISNEGREIHYYTRLKYYLVESNFGKKLDFIKKFHKRTFSKNNAEELERYLEPSSVNRNATLASVDITSNSNLVTWAGLSPEVISDELVTVKEYNMETACVQYNYFIKGQSSTGKEIYHVKEFYRVRHASGNNYLLNFHRTLEAEFDPSHASVSASQLKLGITGDTNSRMIASKDEKTLYFARGGTLYCYKMSENKIVPVYSSFSSDASYRLRAYNEQGIRLLKLSDEDTLYFCVYGYFARGSYEGDVAVVLYEYSEENGLREMVYMPISSTFQQLQKDFDDYGYVSSRGIYYFSVADTVYAYNMMGKRLEKIVQHVKSSSFVVVPNANCFAWSSSMGTGCGDSITIFNLEEDRRQTINAPSKKVDVRLLGVIEDNLVYGYVKKKDIGRDKTGIKVMPCYELYIADMEGNVLKKYTRNKKYVRGIISNGNVINITLCKKDGSIYTDAGADSILNQSNSKVSKFSYTSRVTNRTLTEWYIRFPSSFVMEQAPEFAEKINVFSTNGRIVRLDQPKVTRYYVYAVGEITDLFESAAKAIREADKKMGVVVSSGHQVVWERSGSFLQNSIGGIEITKSSRKISSEAACAYMVLRQNHVDVTLPELQKSGEPVYNMLASRMEKAVNLKGCTLEQVLYFVSGNKSVVASLGNGRSFIIEGYTTTKLYLIDPDAGRRITVNRAEYDKKFRNTGNCFVSYLM